jgi:hypothetical protein
MKTICSYVYTRLAGIEVEDEPEDIPEPVSFAIEAIANIDGLLGPAPITLETLKADPTGYLRHVWTFLNEMAGPNGRQWSSSC